MPRCRASWSSRESSMSADPGAGLATMPDVADRRKAWRRLRGLRLEQHRALRLARARPCPPPSAGHRRAALVVAGVEHHAATSIPPAAAAAIISTGASSALNTTSRSPPCAARRRHAVHEHGDRAQAGVVPVGVGHLAARRVQPGHVLACAPRRAPLRNVSRRSQSRERRRSISSCTKRNRPRVRLGKAPVEPGDLVVLAIGVVVAALRAAELVAGQQHRHALRQEQRREQVARPGARAARSTPGSSVGPSTPQFQLRLWAWPSAPFSRLASL